MMAHKKPLYCDPMPRDGYFHDYVDGYFPTIWTHCWGKRPESAFGWKVILSVKDGKPYIFNADSEVYSKGLDLAEHLGPFETLDAAFVALELI